MSQWRSFGGKGGGRGRKGLGRAAYWTPKTHGNRWASRVCERQMADTPSWHSGPWTPRNWGFDGNGGRGWGGGSDQLPRPPPRWVFQSLRRTLPSPPSLLAECREGPSLRFLKSKLKTRTGGCTSWGEDDPGHAPIGGARGLQPGQDADPVVGGRWGQRAPREPTPRPHRWGRANVDESV